ncbi:MAG TPA: PQQ-binding-like beta-propeller repeat protein [Candidatus Acidoferrales bacterium]|nr:PQQ-binding-like beta-propeller repeat protein [Candidatus Acidoferrales bacterium]
MSFVTYGFLGQSMSRPLMLRCVALLYALCFLATTAISQSLDMRWKKDFPKEVSWYVRTSPGILLVRVGRSLTALDGVDGRQLWALPDVGSSEVTDSDVSLLSARGKNLLEVPGLGVLLLNRVKLPGDADGRLIALNLMTGERLWDHPQLDNLVTAVLLDGTRHVVLVSARLQKKILAGEVAASAALSAAVRFPIALAPYPYRFEFQRLDPVTGKVLWNSEYPRTFTPGAINLAVIADDLFLEVGNSILGSIDLVDGNRLWEEGPKLAAPFDPPLPLLSANGWLIYGFKNVQAVDATTKQVHWEIKGLGKITGISALDGVVVAIGNENIAAVDARTGNPLWRRKTHGHTTNLLWDKHSDTMIYVDGKGLHSVERKTGKSLLDASLHSVSNPLLIRRASREVVVTIAPHVVCAYDIKTGKKLFDAGKFAGFFSSFAFPDFVPMPAEGQGLYSTTLAPSGRADWSGVAEGSLFSDEGRKRLEGYRAATEDFADAFETESESGMRKIWWVDAQTSQQIGFQLTGTQHDVSRPLGMLFGIEGKQVWGDAFSAKQKPDHR